MLSYGVCHQLKIINAEWYSLFIFSSTFLTYNVQRFVKATQTTSNQTNLIKWLNSHRRQQYFLMTISFTILIISFFKIYNFGIVVLGILGGSALLNLFYVIPLKNKSLRDIPYLKIHLISMIWVIAIGGIQLLNENNFELKNWLFIAVHYFYILAVTIPFDIRDLQYDNPNQKTIPQVLGIRRSKILSVSLLLIYFVLAIQIKPLLFSNFAFLIIVLFTTTLIIMINNKRNEFFFSGLIEGCIFVLGFTFLLN